jgi:hypothetical protein
MQGNSETHLKIHSKSSRNQSFILYYLEGISASTWRAAGLKVKVDERVDDGFTDEVQSTRQ